jgi:hypothetical protein
MADINDIQKKIEYALLLIDKIKKPWKYSNNRRKRQGLPLIRRGGKKYGKRSMDSRKI